jgi:hypothetical protein
VRHRLVKEIIRSYEASEELEEAEKLKLREKKEKENSDRIAKRESIEHDIESSL